MKGIFIKYGEEDHLKQIVNGSIRFSPSQTYVNMEKILHDKGQGDLLDGRWVINNVSDGRLIDHKTGDEFAIPENAKFYLTIQDVNTMPVFCLSHYGEECLKSVAGKLEFSLPEGRIDAIRKDFPKATHALMILDPDLFCEDIGKIEGHTVIGDNTHYYNFDVNDEKMFLFLTMGNENIKSDKNVSYNVTYENRYRYLLCKDIYFKNQDEYRMIAVDELIDTPKTYKFEFKSRYKILPIDNLCNSILLE